jgi:hypothetical protein
LAIDLNSDGDFTDPDESEQVAFFGCESFVLPMGAGNDRVEIAYAGGGTTTAIQIDLGAGDDQLAILNSGDLTSSQLLIECVGGAGNDSMNLAFPDAAGSSVLLRLDGGIGDDTIDIASEGLNASRFEINANLGVGNNSAKFHATQAFTNASSVRLEVVGGAQIDTVLCAFEDNVQSHSSFAGRVDLGAGDDSLRIELATQTFDVGNTGGGAPSRFEFDAKGGLGDDRLEVSHIFDGVPHSGTFFNEGIFALRFDGGDGDDALVCDLGAFTMASLTAGPPAALIVRFNGGLGNDALTFIGGDALGSSFKGDVDVQLRGGAGNDSLETLANFSAATFGVGGSLLLDGGPGVADSALNIGPGPALFRNCELR